MVKNCQVTGIKEDMISMRNEMDIVHHVKDEMEELRDVVDRMEDMTRRRKSRLLEQVIYYYLTTW